MDLQKRIALIREKIHSDYLGMYRKPVGIKEAATDLAEKTIQLFARDFERFGALHEYYQPENGEPILNRGFHNWNCLVLNMIAWIEGQEVVEEF